MATTIEEHLEGLGQKVDAGVEGLRKDFGERFDAQDGRAEGQEKRLADVEAQQEKILKQLEEKAAKGWIPGLSDDKDCAAFSIAKVMAYEVDKSESRRKAAAMELDICKQAREKNLMSVTDSAAGFLVPPEVLGSEFIDLLKSASITRTLGARVISGLTGSPVKLPRKVTASTVEHKSEGEAASATTLTVGEMTLQPKAVTAYIPVTDLLLQLDTNPDIENMIREDLAEEIALKQDYGMLKGLGNVSEPLGVLNDPDVPEPNSAGAGALSYDRMANLYAEPVIQNALRFGSFAWAFPGIVFKDLIKLKDGDGRPLFNPAPSGTQPSAGLLGAPWAVSNQLGGTSGSSDGEMIFGAWPQMLVLEWGGLNIMYSQHATAGGINAFTQGYTFIKATRWYDGGLKYPAAFAFDNDLTLP